MDTVFHKIVAGEADSYIIHQDDQFMAILDIFPQYYGQVLVIPKQEQPSKFSRVDSKVLQNLVPFAQKVAKHVEDRLDDVERCIFVIEGLEIDYLHAKLFPVRDAGQDGINHHHKDTLKDVDFDALQQQLAF